VRCRGCGITIAGIAKARIELVVRSELNGQIAGNPPLLGFTGITWVALAGHVLFALVAAAMMRWRGVR
jgi:hypothetical protein